MRDAQDIRDLKLTVNGRAGKIVGFWVTESSEVYVKVKDYKGCFVNHRLGALPEYMEIQKIAEDETYQTV